MHNASCSAWLAAIFGLVQLLAAAPAAAAEFSAGPGDDLVVLVDRMQDGDRLTLEAGRYVGGVVVEGRSLAILGPDSGEAIIDAPSGTNVLIGAVSGATLQIERLSFAPSTEAPLALFVQGASATCIDCRFASTPDAPVYAEASRLTLVGGSMADIGGNGVVAVSGTTLEVRDMRIERASGKAIISQDAAATALSGLAVSGGGGVLVTGEGPLELRHSRIETTDQGAALQLQGSGTSRIEASHLQAEGTGLQAFLAGAASLSIVDTTALGAAGGLYAESQEGAAPALDVRGGRFLATGSRPAVGLFGVASAELVDTLMLSPDIGVYLGEGSGAALTGNTVIGLAYGIGVPDGLDGSGHRLAGNLVVSDVPLSGPLDIDGGTARIAAALAADPAAVESLRADLAVATAVETPADAAAVERIVATASTVRDAAGRFGTVQVAVADASGREERSGFAVLDEAGMIASESVAGMVVALPAGRHRIAPLFDLSRVEVVDLAEGVDESVVVAVPRSLWVSIANAGETAPRLRLFQALPAETAARLLRANGFEWRLEQVRAFPRPGASADAIAEALTLARQSVATLAAVTDPPPDNAWQDTTQARIEARRILAVHGDAADARLLLESVMPVWDDATSGALAAAYLEARLGTLGTGAVMAQLGQADPSRALAAAIALRVFGVPAARDTLLQWLADPVRPDRAQFVHLLRQENARAVTDAYRERIEDFISAPRGDDRVWFPSDVLPHLIAYGGEADWQRLGAALALLEEHSMSSVAEALAGYAVDPLAFTERMASLVGEDQSMPQKRLCPLLRVRGPEAFARLNAAIRDQSSVWWQQVRNSRNNYVQYYLEASGCWPTETAAQYYHTGEVELTGNYFALPTIPEWWHLDELLSGEVAGSLNASYFDQIDYVEPARLQAAFDAAGGPKVPDPALRRAYRSVITRAGQYDFIHSYEDGLERRAFVLRHVDTEDYSGAISGMATIDPQIDAAGELVIRMRLDTVPYYHDCCDLASTIANNNDLGAWLHAPFLLDGGSALIRSVTLTRHGEDVPVTMTGPHALGYRIAAGAAPEGLAGLVLTVELDLFGDRRSLVFDLFAGGKARGFGAGPG